MLLLKKAIKNLWQDISVWILITANLITIYLAIKQHWDYKTILWIYLFQAAIIGFFTLLKLLFLQKLSIEDVRIYSGSERIKFKSNLTARLTQALFFLVHFGMFISVLFFILKQHLGTITLMKNQYIIYGLIIFFVNHFFSFIYNFDQDKNQGKFSGKITIIPYIRILPFLFILSIGGVFIVPLYLLLGKTAFNISLISFLLLKTIADIFGHLIEHLPMNFLKDKEIK